MVRVTFEAEHRDFVIDMDLNRAIELRNMFYEDNQQIIRWEKEVANGQSLVINTRDIIALYFDENQE